ncbi:MAG: PilN domain-containing protein [Elusimicrobiota bacterium]
MIKINLIPPETLEKEARKRFIILISFAASLIVSIAILFFLGRFAIDRALSIRLKNIEIQIKKYQVAVDEVRKLKELTSSLEARRTVIENLMKGRIDYPKFMEDFLVMFPPSIWITSLGTTPIPNGYSLVISCLSNDSMAIADFISNLERNPRYAGVEVGAITSSGGKAEIFTFQIKCQYRIPVEVE